MLNRAYLLISPYLQMPAHTNLVSGPVLRRVVQQARCAIIAIAMVHKVVMKQGLRSGQAVGYSKMMRPW
jgi:hypothetical protein